MILLVFMGLTTLIVISHPPLVGAAALYAACALGLGLGWWGCRS